MTIVEKYRLSTAEADAAILYSPTSVLQNSGVAADARRALFAELSSTGFKVRFLSEEQLARGEFGGMKLLFCAGAEYLPRNAAAGLSRFARQGGRIFADRISLRKNEFGNPLKRDFPVTELSDAPVQLKAALPPLPVSLEGAVDGIFCRMVPEADGNWLINLVNYTHRPVSLVLRGEGVFEDLLGNAPSLVDPLPPLKPQLIRFSPRGQ